MRTAYVIDVRQCFSILWRPPTACRSYTCDACLCRITAAWRRSHAPSATHSLTSAVTVSSSRLLRSIHWTPRIRHMA